LIACLDGAACQFAQLCIGFALGRIGKLDGGLDESTIEMDAPIVDLRVEDPKLLLFWS